MFLVCHGPSPVADEGKVNVALVAWPDDLSCNHEASLWIGDDRVGSDIKDSVDCIVKDCITLAVDSPDGEVVVPGIKRNVVGLDGSPVEPFLVSSIVEVITDGLDHIHESPGFKLLLCDLVDGVEPVPSYLLQLIVINDKLWVLEKELADVLTCQRVLDIGNPGPFLILVQKRTVCHCIVVGVIVLGKVDIGQFINRERSGIASSKVNGDCIDKLVDHFISQEWVNLVESLFNCPPFPVLVVSLVIDEEAVCCAMIAESTVKELCKLLRPVCGIEP